MPPVQVCVRACVRARAGARAHVCEYVCPCQRPCMSMYVSKYVYVYLYINAFMYLCVSKSLLRAHDRVYECLLKQHYYLFTALLHNRCILRDTGLSEGNIASLPFCLSVRHLEATHANLRNLCRHLGSFAQTKLYACNAM